MKQSPIHLATKIRYREIGRVHITLIKRNIRGISEWMADRYNGNFKHKDGKKYLGEGGNIGTAKIKG